MDWMEIGTAVGGVLLMLLARSGILKMWAHVPREVGEALVAFGKYIEDPNPTEEKRQAMLKEWGDVISIGRRFMGR